MQHPASILAPVPLAFGVGTLWFEQNRSGLDRHIVNGIKTALEVGFRHIDSAQMYNNEPELGIAIKESGLPRSELVITSKTLDLDHPEKALQATLKNLGTSYVDMYLIHAPFWATSPSHLQDAWRRMEDCVRQGLARNIGVSSFAEQHIDCLLEIATIRPAVVQVEMHPYLPQSDLRLYLRDKNIPMEVFGCLTPLTDSRSPPLNDICKSLSEKYGVSESTILLKWAIQQDTRVVTTSGKKGRLLQYLDEISSFQLTEFELHNIIQCCKGKHVRRFFEDEFEALQRH